MSKLQCCIKAEGMENYFKKTRCSPALEKMQKEGHEIRDFHNVFIDEVKVSKSLLQCSRKVNYHNSLMLTIILCCFFFFHCYLIGELQLKNTVVIQYKKQQKS